MKLTCQKIFKRVHFQIFNDINKFPLQSNGEVQDIKIMDWQCSCAGSPVKDLSYLFYSGTTGEHLDQLDDYLKIYHHSLRDTLKEYDLNAENIYSYETFKEEWKKYSNFGFMLSLMLWKVKLCDPTTTPDQIVDDFDTVIHVADDHKEKYKQTIRQLVSHMYKHNYL